MSFNQSTTREEALQRAGQIRLDAAPRMVQKRHRQGDWGYSVIAASNTSTGDEVGWDASLPAARQRAEELRADPERWLGGQVQPLAIYSIEDLRIVERYGTPCGESTLCPDDSIRRCVLDVGHEGYHDGGVK
jgi:hypothetical protein